MWGSDTQLVGGGGGGIKCEASKSIDYLNLRKRSINNKLEANPILNIIKRY